MHSNTYHYDLLLRCFDDWRFSNTDYAVENSSRCSFVHFWKSRAGHLGSVCWPRWSTENILHHVNGKNNTIALQEQTGPVLILMRWYLFYLMIVWKDYAFRRIVYGDIQIFTGMSISLEPCGLQRWRWVSQRIIFCQNLRGHFTNQTPRRWEMAKRQPTQPPPTAHLLIYWTLRLLIADYRTVEHMEHTPLLRVDTWCDRTILVYVFGLCL